MILARINQIDVEILFQMIAFQTFVSALILSLHILVKSTHVDTRLANIIYKHKLQ